jgi:hypothetical protein
VVKFQSFDTAVITAMLALPTKNFNRSFFVVALAFVRSLIQTTLAQRHKSRSVAMSVEILFRLFAAVNTLSHFTLRNRVEGVIAAPQPCSYKMVPPEGLEPPIP